MFNGYLYRICTLWFVDGEDSTFVGSENTEDRQDGNADKGFFLLCLK